MPIKLKRLLKYPEIAAMRAACPGIRMIVDEATTSEIGSTESLLPALSFIGNVGQLILSLEDEQGRRLCPIYLDFACTFFQRILVTNKNPFETQGHDHIRTIYEIVLILILLSDEDPTLRRDYIAPIVTLLHLVPNHIPLQPDMLYTCNKQALERGFSDNSLVLRHLMELAESDAGVVSPLKLFVSGLLCCVYCAVTVKTSSLWGDMESSLLSVARDIVYSYIVRDIHPKLTRSQEQRTSEMDGTDKIKLLKIVLHTLNGEDIDAYKRSPKINITIILADIINRLFTLRGSQIGQAIDVVEVLMILFSKLAGPADSEILLLNDLPFEYYMSNMEVFTIRLIDNCPDATVLLDWMLNDVSCYSSEITILITSAIIEKFKIEASMVDELLIPTSVRWRLRPRNLTNKIDILHSKKEGVSRTMSVLQLANMFSSVNVNKYPNINELQDFKDIMDSKTVK